MPVRRRRSSSRRRRAARRRGGGLAAKISTIVKGQREFVWSTQYAFSVKGATNHGTIEPLMEVFDAFDIALVHNAFVPATVANNVPIALVLRVSGTYTIKSDATYDQTVCVYSWRPRYDCDLQGVTLGTEVFTDIPAQVIFAAGRANIGIGSRFLCEIGLDIMKISTFCSMFKLRRKYYRLRAGAFLTFQHSTRQRYVNCGRVTGANNVWSTQFATNQFANLTHGKFVHVEGSLGVLQNQGASTETNAEFEKPAFSISGTERYSAYPELGVTSSGKSFANVALDYGQTVTAPPMVASERLGQIITAVSN